MLKRRLYLCLHLAFVNLFAASCKARNPDSSEVKASPYGYAAPNVDTRDFDAEVLRAPAGEPIVVMFHAEGWTTPRKIAAFYAAAEENRSIVFRTVDYNRDDDLFLSYGVNPDAGGTTSNGPVPGLPVILIFKDGKPVRRLEPPDSFSKVKIDSAINPPQEANQEMIPGNGGG